MQSTMINARPMAKSTKATASLKASKAFGGVQAFQAKARSSGGRQQMKVQAYDQSFRYADLDLDEEELLAGEGHLLCAYRLEPKPEYGFLETAAHVAAESSTGTNVEVGTTDDFTRGVDAMVYDADEDTRIIKLAYPTELFDRNLIDDQMMLCQITSLIVGNNQGMGDVIGIRLMDFHVPEPMLALLDGPQFSILDLYDVLERPDRNNGGFVVGTIVKPKLGLRPKPFEKACYDFWLGGDFIKNDEPQGNQTYCRMKEVMPLVLDSMKRAQDDTGLVKIFSANVTADDPAEMETRWTYINELFGENQSHLAFLVDGYVAGPTAVTHVQRNNPNNFCHYHRAGHGSATNLFNPRGYPTQVHCKWARMMGASGIHTGTMGYGKMEGENKDREIAYMLERDVATYEFYEQEWFGMKPCTPIISGGMNALRMPGFFKNLGHCNLITTAGGGSYGHIDGPSKGATSMRQSSQCYLEDADPIAFAKDHEEFARAFETFQGDADKLYPGWREQLQTTRA